MSSRSSRTKSQYQERNVLEDRNKNTETQTETKNKRYDSSRNRLFFDSKLGNCGILLRLIVNSSGLRIVVRHPRWCHHPAHANNSTTRPVRRIRMVKILCIVKVYCAVGFVSYGAGMWSLLLAVGVWRSGRWSRRRSCM